MGALHEGHLTLIRKARALAGPKGTVAVSVFVNPTQFGPKEDFSKYPRPISEDIAKCEEEGVNLLFNPKPEDFYAPDASTWVNEITLSTGLCGASRPIHFRGVCTVVSKLFNLFQADIGVFGKKDYQQLAILRRMVRDLNMPIKLVGVEIHREPDGLAMSSRNRYLSPKERSEALILRRSLVDARKAAKAGEHSPAKLRDRVAKTIATSPIAKIDYVEAVDAETLAQPGPDCRKLLIAVAVAFGKTRLIDNIEISL
jgi:pantoate--beta-alanine ligase